MMIRGAGPSPGDDRITGGTPVAPAFRVAPQARASGDAGGQAGKLLLLRPDCQHLALVVGAEIGGRRVVQRRRLRPITRLAVEFLQKPRSIGGIDLRFERQVQAGEGGGMVHQVDLHAANVDRLHPTLLHGAHRGDCLRLGVIKESLALGIHRPGPGMRSAGGRIAPTALDPANGGQQIGRDCAAVFCRGNCHPAQQALGDRWLQDRFSPGRRGQRQQGQCHEAEAPHGADHRTQALAKG